MKRINDYSSLDEKAKNSIAHVMKLKEKIQKHYLII